MSPPTEEKIYRPPGEDLCTPDNGTLALDDEVEIRWAFQTYGSQIVHFAVSLWCEGNELTRIDTAHGTVHQHTFPVTDHGDKRIIEVIPVQGRSFVHQQYQVQMDFLIDHAVDIVAEWRAPC